MDLVRKKSLALICLSLFPPLLLFSDFMIALNLISFLLYLFGCSYLIGGFFAKKKIHRILSGTLLILSASSIILSVIYWFFQVNKLVIAISYGITPILVYLFSNFFLQYRDSEWSFNLNINFSNYTLLWVVTCFIYLGLFFWMYQARTGIDLSSPWSQTGKLFVLAASGTTVFLLFSLKQTLNKISKILLLILHYGLFFSVVLIIYKHGFGFDPFIHQASEKLIAQQGVITPKKPFYIAQYMIVVSWHMITDIPIDIIDSLLVPVSASTALPLVLVWKERNGLSWQAAALFPISLLSFLVVTTPFNLALLFGLIIVFFAWKNDQLQSNNIILLNLILTLFTLLIHPLVGIPIFIYLTAKIWSRKTEYDWKKNISSSFCLTTAIPIILISFLVWTNRGGFVNPLNQLEAFLQLFNQPSWYMFWQAPWYWQLIYLYKFAVVPVVILTSLFKIITTEVKDSKAMWFELFCLAGLVISSLLITTTIEVKNVISLEKNSYADRTLSLAYVLLLPYFYSVLKNIFNYLTNKNFIYHTIGVILASLALGGSLYFTYPTKDPISLPPSHSVRDEDIQAVNLIDELNQSKDYIVLTNQMVGAAALDQFGFAKYHKLDNGTSHYFYSIPAGGKLYSYFGEIVYNSVERKWIKKAMDMANVDKVYFIHTNYWYPAVELKNKLSNIADKRWKVGENGEVWIFKFKRKNSK